MDRAHLAEAGRASPGDQLENSSSVEGRARRGESGVIRLSLEAGTTLDRHRPGSLGLVSGSPSMISSRPLDQDARAWPGGGNCIVLGKETPRVPGCEGEQLPSRDGKAAAPRTWPTSMASRHRLRDVERSLPRPKALVTPACSTRARVPYRLQGCDIRPGL